MRISLGLSFVLGALIAAGCTGGGGGSSSTSAAAPTQTGGVTPAATSYVNPAWTLPVALPSKYWDAYNSPATTLPDWFTSRPYLLDLSSWSSYMQQASPPTRGWLGAYGIGNGRCFGMIGMSYPTNTLHASVGPQYQESGGFMGDYSIGLEVEPMQVAFTDEWVYQPRKKGITVTKESTSNVELLTVDFAPPGVNAICRIVLVKNDSTQTMLNVNVLVKGFAPPVVEGSSLAEYRGDRKMTTGSVPAASTPFLGGVMRVPMGAIPAGQTAVGLVYHVFSYANNPADEQATIATIRGQGSDALLDSTRRFWESFFAQGAQLTFPDQRVQDWVDQYLLCDQTQTSEVNGIPSPMSRYTKTWMRDSEGPLRLFLQMGRHDYAKRLLDSYYKTSILSGGIYNSMAAAMDCSQAPPPPDWMTAGFMDGRNPVEAPSYITTNMWAYYTASGDTAMLAEQYDYLKASVLRQTLNAQDLMQFNGDEPFRWVMAAALGLYEPENRGYSSNSAFLLVAAADRLATIAGILGKTADQQRFFQLAQRVRAATDSMYFLPAQGFYDVCVLFQNNIHVGAPFEDVSLMPLRIGYAPPTDPMMKSNILSCMQKLGHADGSFYSNFLVQPLNAYDGMVPGYYVSDLAMIDHPGAEAAFNNLARVARPSGEIAEGHYTGSNEVIVLKYQPAGGGDGDITARYRPWEGSLCVVGALDYLLGVDPDAMNGVLHVTPHMPNGWGSLAARSLEFMGGRYDVEVRDFGNRRLVRVTNQSTKQMTVDVGVSIVCTSMLALRVDGLATAMPAIDAEFGRQKIRVTKSIAPGQWVDVDVDYQK